GKDGDFDGFVVKLSGDGTFLWSTYLGGNDHDESVDVALDRAGNVCVGGFTSSPGWLTGGFDTELGGSWDAFVVKLALDGNRLWSTYLGGAGTETGNSIAADGEGFIYVTGYTTSADWAEGGFDSTLGGERDAYLAKLTPDGALVWSSYLGGGDLEWGGDLATDGGGHIGVGGHTRSPDWVHGGYDETLSGPYGDGFVSMISELDAAVRVTIEPPAAVAAGAKWRRVGTTDWLASGATETGVSASDGFVEFKLVAGWDAPVVRECPVRYRQLTSITAYYAPSALNAVDPRLWTLY
ncbi:MAG: SBBP repeat-containing protein, partial [bacterium]|nr:SBBP repeat-containing protein [bacterium]